MPSAAAAMPQKFPQTHLPCEDVEEEEINPPLCLQETGIKRSQCPGFKGHYTNYYANYGHPEPWPSCAWIISAGLSVCPYPAVLIREAASFTHLLLFSIERVGADPWVGDGEPWGQVEGGQEGGEGAFQEVRVPTHGVLRLAHVRALGEEADVAGWEESRKQGKGAVISRRMQGGLD